MRPALGSLMPDKFPLGDVLALLGVASAIIVAVLRERFRTTFATRDELNGIGAKHHAFETLLIQTRDRADAAHALAERALQHGERVDREVNRVLDEMKTLTSEMRQTREAMVRLEEGIKHLRGDRD